MKEDRLDRIEKGMEDFFRGMQKLREEADEFREGMKELRESQKKTEKLIRELRESQKKTDEQLDRTDKQLCRTDEKLEKTIKKLDEIGRQLGDLGLVQGEIAEDLFYRNVNYLFKNKKLKFGEIHRNLKHKGIAEYDIVAVGKDRVLVIEVKNKLMRRMVDKFVTEKIPKFREAFPQYRDYRLFAGMGALVVKDEIGKYAEKAGLYVLTQSGDGGAMLINPKDFVAKEFV